MIAIQHVRLALAPRRCYWERCSLRVFCLPPGICNPAAFIKKYARKHNPLISFNNVRNNPARCAKIVNSAQLDKDLAGNAREHMNIGGASCTALFFLHVGLIP